MKKMIKNTIFGLALLMGSQLWAGMPAGTLFGTVVDDCGEPLPTVTVVVERLHLDGAEVAATLVTDLYGMFLLQDLQPGHYRVMINNESDIMGFESKTLRYVRVDQQDIVKVAVSLEPLTSFESMPLFHSELDFLNSSLWGVSDQVAE